MRTALLLVLLLAGCARGDPSDAGAPAASVGPVASFSRDASAPTATGSNAAEPAALGAADPAALDELLAAVPKATPPAPGPDGGTPIGGDTGIPDPPPASASSAAAAPSGQVSFGKVIVQAQMAGPAIERAARAQLYWRLVQKCRDKDGAILPPEAVHIHFKVDGDGYIASSTIMTDPKSTRFAEAARCMQRELSTATFRAPASARGQIHTIEADVPSVD